MTNTGHGALDTLFYGMEHADASVMDGRVLFINARADKRLPSDVQCVQWFKPYADDLVGAGFESVSVIEDVSGEFDTSLLLFPKNVVEGRYLLARAMEKTREGGSIFVSADNKAGGTRLQKIVQQFGAEIVQQNSKNKARVIEIVNRGVDQGVIAATIREGSLKSIDKTGFVAQAGVYGWDKIDKGSQILLQHLGDGVKGKIADFGVGYGFLLQHILQHKKDVKLAYAIDADARALLSAQENLCDFGAVEYLWADLTNPAGIPERLDSIIMNPPFHEGKKADSGIGAAFIRTAAQCLKRNGSLYMVANNQLPYEVVLEDAFFSYECIVQENGFKVFRAVV